MNSGHNSNLFEQGIDIHQLFHETDGNTDITGDWISMRDYRRAYIRLKKGGSEQVDNGALQLLQATSAAGAGSKALSVSRAWYKTGAMTGQGVWTKVDVANSILAYGASLAPTNGAADRVIPDVTTNVFDMIVEVKAEELDAGNGFKFVTAFIEGDDVNNSVLYSADIILANGAFPQAIPLNPLA
jgi:hypothetical protein